MPKPTSPHWKNAGVDARIEPEQPVTFSLAETHETEAGDGFSRTGASPMRRHARLLGDDLPEYSTLNVFTIGSGRIGRLRYLAWTLVLTVTQCSLPQALSPPQALRWRPLPPTAGVILGSPLGFRVRRDGIWVSVQIGVQRLHDLGWSGWLYLLNLVPLVNSIFPLLLLECCQ